MRNHIVVICGSNDKFSEQFKGEKNVLVVPFGIEGHKDEVDSSIYRDFAKHQMTIDPTAEEFLHFAISAYTGDVRVKRADSFDCWTREFHLWMPVRHPKKWNELKAHFENLLRFLTGDQWMIYFRKRDKSYSTPEPEQKTLGNTSNSNVVSLFSGGLDSYIGAIDLIKQGKRPLLVGHHSLGGGPTSVAQTKAIEKIKLRYENRATFLHLWVSPKKGEHRASEITTRGRSIMFIGLALLCTKGAGCSQLFVPENGFISLNVPLTRSRSGSFSTRTTHPYYIWLLQKIFNHLQLKVELVLPYKFKTKGEMIAECLDQESIKDALKGTMSCSHPGVNRWLRGGNPNAHCGYCVPCIIRKGAVSLSRRDPTRYSYKLDKKLSENRAQDLKAFKMAISKMKEESISLVDILASGPIPGDDEVKNKHLEVYIRGLREASDVI